MKKTIYLLLLMLAFGSCKKEESKGSIEVKLSYYFNAIQGYKPDVGAKIYLFKDEGKDIDRNTMIRIGFLDYKDGSSAKKISEAEADVTGSAKLENIPFGKYIIVAGSKGRYTYSLKNITINSASTTLVKNFGYLSEFEDRGEIW